MRGFAAGSLTLIVLYVLLQQGSADKVAGGGNLAAALIRRALSPEVAGVPDRAAGAGRVGAGLGGAAAKAGQAGADALQGLPRGGGGGISRPVSTA
jgi:hypothetical protein